MVSNRLAASREIGDWRLDVEGPGDFTLSSSTSSSWSTSARRLQCDDATFGWHSTCSGNIEHGDLCHGRDGTLHCACYERRHTCGVDVVVGKSVLLVGRRKKVLATATRDEL